MNSRSCGLAYRSGAPSGRVRNDALPTAERALPQLDDGSNVCECARRYNHERTRSSHPPVVMEKVSVDSEVMSREAAEDNLPKLGVMDEK